MGDIRYCTCATCGKLTNAVGYFSDFDEDPSVFCSLKCACINLGRDYNDEDEDGENSESVRDSE